LTGKFAFLRNIPHPQPTLVANHGYCSLMDCVADVIAYGAPLDVTQSLVSLPSEGEALVKRYASPEGLSPYIIIANGYTLVSMLCVYF
jgi:hypothetical protein